jgi:hypothetical protein
MQSTTIKKSIAILVEAIAPIGGNRFRIVLDESRAQVNIMNALQRYNHVQGTVVAKLAEQLLKIINQFYPIDESLPYCDLLIVDAGVFHYSAKHHRVQWLYEPPVKRNLRAKLTIMTMMTTWKTMPTELAILIAEYIGEDPTEANVVTEYVYR